MPLTWMREEPPLWDEAKARLIGEAPPASFPQPLRFARGERLPGQWWRAQDGKDVVGYGWLDNVAGEAEVSLVTSPARRGAGIGAFIMDRLQAEAQSQGINRIYNTVNRDHPQREQLTAWLKKIGFHAAEDGSLRRTAAPRSGRSRSGP